MDTRRLDIQGLRALAVALVVLYHAGLPLPGGFVGVDVFFVISGFVITAMLRREMATHGRVDLRRFYARRMKRLLLAVTWLLERRLRAVALTVSAGSSSSGRSWRCSRHACTGADA